MSLHMTEDEYLAFLKRRKEAMNAKKSASPTCCQLARPSGVSLADMDDTEKPKRAKYNNHKVTIDGMKFDSVHEAKCYEDLILRVRAGELKCVCRQVPFDLPGGIKYIADFVTIRPDMSIEGVYDAKSPITRQNRVYINKKKQIKAIWDIDIIEI